MKEAAEALRSTGTSSSVQSLPAEMDDVGVVFLTCDSGHKTAMLHRNRKHQILFESGCLALLDDYTNEAVSSISAALERAYEFFIRVVYRKLGGTLLAGEIIVETDRSPIGTAVWCLRFPVSGRGR